MTFPTVPTSGGGTIVSAIQADTSSTRTFPDLGTLTKNSGDVLVAIAITYGTNVTGVWGTWGAGFTEFADLGASGTMAAGCAWLVSDGTETGTFTVTQAGIASGHAEMIVMAIPGAHGTTAPVASTFATGTTTAADPAALAPSWGAEDTLWIAVGGGGETVASGSFTGVSTAPTNYSNTFHVGNSGAVVGAIDSAAAFRQLNTSSENVGAWTVDTSNARNSAFVIAVRPAVPTSGGLIVHPRAVNPAAVNRSTIF